ncbi:hypothetical protein BH09SUM1_BH09SUM1_29990 [soil metagenome]
MSRLLSAARKHPVMLMLIPGIAIFFANFLAGHRGISGNDANYYFAQAGAFASRRSPGDPSTYEKIAAQGGANWSAEQLAARTPTGWFDNMYPIGHPVLHTPGTLLGAIVGLGSGNGWNPLGPFAQAGFCLSAILAAALGLALMRTALARWFDEDALLFALITMTAATPLGYYWFVQPAMSHTSSLLMAGVICWLFVRILEPKATLWHWAGLGAALGWNVTVRNQDIAFAFIGLAAVWVAWNREGRFAKTVVLIVSAAVAVIPQLLVYRIKDGALFPRQYNNYSHFDWAHPHLFAVLLSPRHGLFFWHPVLFLAAAGVAMAFAERRVPAIVTTSWTMTFAGLWAISAAYSIWWFGDSFGSRPFLSVTPVFLIGFCELWRRAGRWRPVLLAAVALATAWNALLALAYHAAWISRSGPLDVHTLLTHLSRSH